MNFEEYQTGTVRYCPKDKDFGFLMTETGNEYFFHFNQGREVAICSDGSLGIGESCPNPRAGDRILFQLSEGKKGPRAGLWFFADEVNRAVAQVERRRNFRIVDLDNGNQVCWEGRSEDELRQKFIEYTKQPPDLRAATMQGKNFESINFASSEDSPLQNQWQDWCVDEKTWNQVPKNRVVRVTKFFRSQTTTHTNAWIGSDTGELNEKFPRRFKGVDDLAPERYSDSEVSFEFQSLSRSGKWVNGLDPRQPIYPQSLISMRRKFA